MALQKVNQHFGFLVGLIVFQALCTLFFTIDVLSDMESVGLSSFTDLHLLPEMGATLGLIFAMVFEFYVLRRLAHRQATLEKGMSIAAGELAIVMESYFVSWGLTASEQDVASFTIKGYSIAEVSSLRNCAEGTVKTHLNAIYRKSGTNGRAQLVSLLIEDLLRGPLAESTKPAA
jgi:DNA-binding CsgD family transcriptional regulator